MVLGLVFEFFFVIDIVGAILINKAYKESLAVLINKAYKESLEETV